MTHCNIEDSYRYVAEEARINFQGNLASLLELKSFLLEQSTTAQKRGKDGIWLTTHQLETLDKWLVDTTTNLMGNFQILHRTNQLLSTNYEASFGLLLRGLSTNLKDFVKA